MEHTRPHKHSRFGEPNQTNINIKPPGDASSRLQTQVGDSVQPFQTLHIPLQPNPGFNINDVQLSEYDLYLLPALPAATSTPPSSSTGNLNTNDSNFAVAGSLSGPQHNDASTSVSPSLDFVYHHIKHRVALASTVQDDVEDMYWDGQSALQNDEGIDAQPPTWLSPGDDAPFVCLQTSPSRHDLLLQDLVRAATGLAPGDNAADHARRRSQNESICPTIVVTATESISCLVDTPSTSSKVGKSIKMNTASRFGDPASGPDSEVQHNGTTGSNKVLTESLDESTTPTAYTSDTTPSPKTSRGHKPDLKKPRSIAQATLRAVFSQPPPTAGTGCPFPQPFDASMTSPIPTWTRPRQRGSRKSRAQSGKENMPPSMVASSGAGQTTSTTPPRRRTPSTRAVRTPGTPTPIKFTSIQLQTIARAHSNLARSAPSTSLTSRASPTGLCYDSGDIAGVNQGTPMSPTPSASGFSNMSSKCPPLDSWEDICAELKALETMRREMKNILAARQASQRKPETQEQITAQTLVTCA